MLKRWCLRGALMAAAAVLVPLIGCGGDAQWSVSSNNGIKDQTGGSRIIISSGGDRTVASDGGGGGAASAPASLRPVPFPSPEPVYFHSRLELRRYLRRVWDEQPGDPACWPLHSAAGEGGSGAGVSSEVPIAPQLRADDVVASDDETVYVASGDRVHAVDLRDPTRMEVLSTLLVGGRVRTVHLDDSGKLWIVHDGGARGVIVPLGQPLRTGVLVADVRIPASPRVVSHILYDGSLHEAFLANERVHLVLQHALLDPRGRSCICEPVPLAGEAPICHPELGEPRDRIMLARVLPRRWARADGDWMPWGRPLVRARRVLRPLEEKLPALTYTVAIPLAQPRVARRSDAVLGWARPVYASDTILVLAEQLSGATPETWLHQLAIQETRRWVEPRFGRRVALGSVPGEIARLVPWSVDEHAGALRVLTTEEGPGAGSTAAVSWTRLRILEQLGDRLERVGLLDTLPSNGELGTIRMLGDHGFVSVADGPPGDAARSEQLVSLDLSDPADPRAVGSLALDLGQYLLPLADGLLFQNGTPGATASTVDVSRLAMPALVETEVLGPSGSTSSLGFVPQGLRVREEDGLLLVPFKRRTQPPPGEISLDDAWGVQVLRIDEDGAIEPLGFVEVELADQFFGPFLSRGIVRGNVVFAISPSEIRAVRLDDTTQVLGEIALEYVRPPF